VGKFLGATRVCEVGEIGLLNLRVLTAECYRDYLMAVSMGFEPCLVAVAFSPSFSTIPLYRSPRKMDSSKTSARKSLLMNRFA
jgi:hypothetical protein